MSANEPVFKLDKFEVNFPESNLNTLFAFPEITQINPSITLALSGGGARGIAQIGVLKYFEEKKLKINYIVGTSIGAFIGGLYSSGYSARQLEEIVDTTSWNELFTINEAKRNEYFLDQKEINDRNILRLRFQNFSFIVPEALSYGNRFSDYLNLLFWNSTYHSDNDFDKLKYCFRATATDLVSGQPVVFKSGNIINIVRASGNLPLRNSPVRIDSMLLIDGGIFQNIPSAAAGNLGSDLTILINTVSPLMKTDDLNKPWNVADQVVSIMMKKFEQSASELSDIVIMPELNSITNTDFQKANQLIDIGYKAASERYDFISRKIDSIKEKKMNQFYQNFKSLNISFANIRPDSTFDSKFISRFGEIASNPLDDDKIKFEKIIEAANYLDYHNIYLKKAPDGNIIIFGERYPVIKNIFIHSSSQSLIAMNDEINREYSGLTLKTDNFRDICEAIVKKMRKHEYPYAKIDDVKFRNGDLHISIVEGIVSQIELKSKLEADDYLIRRELKIKTGKELKLDDMRKSWENLAFSDLFANVNFDFNQSGADSAINVRIALIEKGNQMFSFGSFIDNERYLQAGIDLIHYNLFNSGTNINIRTVAGIRNFFSKLTFSQQRFLNTMVTAQISGYYDYKKRWTFRSDYLVPPNRFGSLIDNEIIEEAFGVKGSAGFQLAKLGNINIEYRYERQRNFYRDSILRSPFITVNSIKVETIFDNRDRLDFATRGRYLNLSLETSLFRTTVEPTFSKVSFIQTNNFNFGLTTLRPRIIFVLADKTLPFNEFYRIGGMNTFYGYREDEIFGRQVAVASLEYEVKMPFALLFDTYFSMRYDIGSAWLAPETIKFRNLKHGFGICLSLDTPIGPARLAAGEAFYFISDPRGAKFGYPNVYFSIGVRL